MNTRTRIHAPAILVSLIAWALVLGVLLAVAWVWVTLATQPATPTLAASQDSCAAAVPPTPCLSAVNPTVADNLVMWGIFLIGTIAGLALAFVLTAPAAYRLGKREGYNDGITMRRNMQHASRR